MIQIDDRYYDRQVRADGGARGADQSRRSAKARYAVCFSDTAGWLALMPRHHAISAPASSHDPRQRRIPQRAGWLSPQAATRCANGLGQRRCRPRSNRLRRASCCR